MNQMELKNFKWLNESDIKFEKDGTIVIYAPAESDLFCSNGAIAEDGITPKSLCNAPFLHTEVSGDFVMRVKTMHDFKDTYDAACILIMENMDIWAKSCFELTDLGTHAVVSVVTNHLSDDANGCNIEGNEVWLQVARVGNSFAFHYSTDGTHFDMMRFFTLPVGDTVKVGLLSQAPIGQGGNRIYQNFSLEKKSVKNIRMGK